MTQPNNKGRFSGTNFLLGENCWRSMKWESENLRDLEIFPLLRDRSIIFKLKAGSADASFLSMFCPVETAPYLVVLKSVYHLPPTGLPSRIGLD